MWTPKDSKDKIIVLSVIMALTLANHYGWVLAPIFNNYHWIHSLHGRFCYIPIVIAASWFGLRGGLYSATLISALVLPYIFGRELSSHDLAGELVELVFYFFIGFLIGALVDREFFARKKRQEAELQVERSQKLSLVGQMAAGVAHEIKNPLTSIKGAADILTDDRTPAKVRSEFSEILRDEVRRIDTTVAEFLAFARPRETKFERTDLSEIITSCVRQLSTQAQSNGVKLECRITADIVVNGDSEKLRQMTLNLGLNAIQATHTNELVTISLERKDASMARLIINDNGNGIEGDDLDRVFEPFFTTKSSGTGLGLAIVKSIVDNHDGIISLVSDVSNGTTATVEIPLLLNGEN